MFMWFWTILSLGAPDNSRTHDYTQLRDRNQHLSDMITGFKKINNLKLVYKFKKRLGHLVAGLVPVF